MLIQEPDVIHFLNVEACVLLHVGSIKLSFLPSYNVYRCTFKDSKLIKST